MRYKNTISAIPQTTIVHKTEAPAAQQTEAAIAQQDEVQQSDPAENNHSVTIQSPKTKLASGIDTDQGKWISLMLGNAVAEHSKPINTLIMVT